MERVNAVYLPMNSGTKLCIGAKAKVESIGKINYDNRSCFVWLWEISREQK
jgi:hypothetical protein